MSIKQLAGNMKVKRVDEDSSEGCSGCGAKSWDRVRVEFTYGHAVEVILCGSCQTALVDALTEESVL